MNCIAIDDEPWALDLLVDNISKVSFLNLIGRFEIAEDAMETIAKKPVDLIFIDIQMPGESGLEFIANLYKKPLVIFVTAYKQYALESYDLEVVDYLVKPVTLERFHKACSRAKNMMELTAAKASLAKINTLEHFYIGSGYGKIKIKFEDILWMEGYGDYIKFFLKDTSHPQVLRTTFKELEHELPKEKFIRIHRSYSVAIPSITSIRKNSLFIGKKELPISGSYKEYVEKIFNKGQ
ncbi:LytTR family DNA-binding domain-containing protein [Maribacter confluentis]|uniref:LytTR family DNA-binding domain-containing protein n=1 Tax=Maribacter confluentis TaxID=1656093 RepID=A0ABT8RS53_9FLAO|nr:LytTR family DNA-binding domain-containing protein [Maribacter confluentis]MDO1513728.1 LytTR family DNA-binding domain-containing protein [Maribacter confluentis]